MPRLTDLKLSHFSGERIRAVQPREPQGRRADKPVGLWVSVDGEDDWEQWCIAENFGLPRLAIRHRVTLAPDANILHIDSVAGLDDLTRRYGSRQSYSVSIDWKTIGALHDGIIIAPYQYARRLDGAASSWYYGWDCASGCIWQPRAIASIDVVTDLLRDEAA